MEDAMPLLMAIMGIITIINLAVFWTMAGNISEMKKMMRFSFEKNGGLDWLKEKEEQQKAIDQKVAQKREEDKITD
jgi:hydroxyethylthiazole kinase-like sugar kinase family protein